VQGEIRAPQPNLASAQELLALDATAVHPQRLRTLPRSLRPVVGQPGFPEELEKFCTLDEISFEKSLLVGALKKRRDTVGEPI